MESVSMSPLKHGYCATTPRILYSQLLSLQINPPPEFPNHRHTERRLERALLPGQQIRAPIWCRASSWGCTARPQTQSGQTAGATSTTTTKHIQHRRAEKHQLQTYRIRNKGDACDSDVKHKANFDTVDHVILLWRLQLSCGLCGPTLTSFKSHLSDRCRWLSLVIPEWPSIMEQYSL